jgi:drug/metabolite transporter (DMT)-like permease
MNYDPRRTRATCFILLATLIWGLSFVTQKIAGEHMGAFTYNAVRFALGALSLLPFILFAGKPVPIKVKTNILAGSAAGVMLFAAANLQQFGIVLSRSPSSATEAGFITGLYTVLVPLFGLALGRKTNALTWLGAMLAFSGLALISIGPEGLRSVQASDLYLIAGAFFWAAHILLIDRFANGLHPMFFAAVQFAVASLLSAACAFTFETVSAEGLLAGFWPVLFGGVVVSGVAYTLQVFGQRDIPPARAAIIFSLESLFAAIAAAVFLSEVMTPRKYLGGAVILAGIFLSQVRRRGKRQIW